MLFIFFAVIGCGKFTTSLYTGDVKDLQLNSKEIVNIQNRASEFGTTYKVAVLSDTHDYYKELKKQVAFINARKSEIAFTIHCGDATNLGLVNEWDMFDEVISRLDVPMVLAIGNHDLLSQGESIYKKRYSKDLNFSFVFKDTKFIIQNNNNWESSTVAPDLNFLESELNSSTSPRNMIFGHVQADDSDRYTGDKLTAKKNLFSSYNIDYIINGHNHGHGAGTFSSKKRLTAGSSSHGYLLILTVSSITGITHEFHKM